MKAKKTINQTTPKAFGYDLIKIGLNPQDPKAGISSATNFIKTQLGLNDVLLYSSDGIGNYSLYDHAGTSKEKRKIFGSVLDQKKNNIPKDGLSININGNKVKGLTLIPFLDQKYVLMMVHNQEIDEKKFQKVMTIINESMGKILETTSEIKRIREDNEIDEITQLGNRKAYERKREHYNLKQNGHVTYVLLDLFRLKYVNDNISHSEGDNYIKEAGKIIHKYFPTCKEITTEDGKRKTVYTGDNLFRVGGDEYVLLSKNKTKEEIEQVLPFIISEVEDIELNTEKDYITSINYGIAERTDGESIELLSQEADELLLDDKTNKYRSLGIERRR